MSDNPVAPWRRNLAVARSSPRFRRVARLELAHEKGRSIEDRPENLSTETPARLLDLFVERVALEEGIVLLLLNALCHRLFIALGEIAGGWLPLFAGFGAFQCNSFLHGLNGL